MNPSDDEPGLFTDELKQGALVLAVETEWGLGRDPLGKLLRYLSRVTQGQLLSIVTPFSIEPLSRILERRGYRYRMEKHGNRFVTWIGSRQFIPIASGANDETAFTSFESHAMYFSGRTVVLDVSRMKMPEPMQKIFNALDTLPAHHALFVEHSKVPVLILPEFAARGFTCEICKVSPEKVYLLLYRQGDLLNKEDE